MIEQSKHKRGGFTLTEVLVASSILVVVMVPVLKALTQAHVGSRKIEWKTQGMVFAQAKLDEIRARAQADYDASYAVGNESCGNSYYCRVVDTGYGSDIRTVTVQVGYDQDGDKGLDSSEVSVELKSLITRLD